ncbi:MAG TPA: EFR1 family ferrodoxin [Bacillota bacterium]|nr:EFR1 family ferrodoxin [Bacillota bacterium]
MKGLICYFSTTGNTLLASRYLARKIKNMDFDFHDITKGSIPNLDSYPVIGFAAFADFFGPSTLIRDFIHRLPTQNKKYAFVFNTYGNINGQTLKVLRDLVAEKGFTVISGHGLHTPENYPPLISHGISRSKAPNKRELERFESFIASFDLLLHDLSRGKTLPEAKIKIGLNRILPVTPRETARKAMGEKLVNLELCTECGACKSHCPYQAIELKPKPFFDVNKCHGCWSCFNHCPTHAIFTKQIKTGHYPKPNELLQNKLKID